MHHLEADPFYGILLEGKYELHEIIIGGNIIYKNGCECTSPKKKLIKKRGSKTKRPIVRTHAS